LCVLVLRERVRVPLAAVDLDDQALLGPAQVGVDDAVREDVRRVDLGMREAGFEDEIENDIFEGAGGWSGADGPKAFREPGEFALCEFGLA
jgi:hypothetical protein